MAAILRTRFLFLALGGLLYGYDIGATSCATISIHSSTLNGISWYDLSSIDIGLITSGSLYGALIGSTLASLLPTFWLVVRREELTVTSLMYLVGALVTGLAPDFSVMVIGRFVYGIGIGLAGYEIGSLFVDLVSRWRYMYLASTPLALVMEIGMWWLPASPRWLLLRAIQGEEKEVTIGEMFRGKCLKALVIGGLVLFQQIAEQPSVLYYAATILQTAGFSAASDATRVSILLDLLKIGLVVSKWQKMTLIRFSNMLQEMMLKVRYSGYGPIETKLPLSAGIMMQNTRFVGYGPVETKLSFSDAVSCYKKCLLDPQMARTNENPLTGFDMGGTSTNVSRYAGSYEQVLETQIAGAITQAPQLDINTVAACNGSKLKFQFGACRVGPWLEHIMDDSAIDMLVEDIALGFVNVANETMCRPIRQLTEMKGHETKNHDLACFGGAGPQYPCAIARTLGMKEVFIHQFYGIISVMASDWQMYVEESQEPYYAGYNTESILETSHREALLVNQRQITVDGSNSYYVVEFEKLFQQEYGFKLQNRNIIICDVKVRGVGVTNILKPQELNPTFCTRKVERHYKVYFESLKILGLWVLLNKWDVLCNELLYSTNIKERLDFSCALFGPDGELVANAPHSVGGSLLPDIIVITPIFDNGKLVLFVASRGHHAKINGITPVSMPPFSKSIFEEGAAVVKAFKLVQKGIFQEEVIIKLLTEYIHNVPETHKLQDNLSDLRAQVAANQRGISLIKELYEHYGLEIVQAYMSYVQLNA
ncbi:hypothetical protein ACFE04_014730 [Oxalis oulophora]